MYPSEDGSMGPRIETIAQRIRADHAIGLPELVSTDMASYEALAFDLARDSGMRAALRARLAANRVTQPLFDMHRFTKGFDHCIARVWENSAGGRPQL